MIYAVETCNRSDFEPLLSRMHILRALVFKERLQWDVDVVNGKEIDRFDFEDPLYLLSVNDSTFELEGSVRLLPTTGPNMLRDIFPQLLPDGQNVESPIIWESSRFCIDPRLAHQGVGHVSRVTTELLCGLVEVGLRVGLSHIVSVYDARMARIFRASHCPAEVIGTPIKIGRVQTYAGLFEITQGLWHSIAATGGVLAPVITAEPSQTPASAA